LVAACVGGELHEIGLRMVADFLEMNGWDTHYIGANTPVADIVETVALSRADLLALSATMGFHIPLVADVIKAIRTDPRTAGTRVMVGGYPFSLVDDLWVRVGADGSASDAAGALDLAERLVAV
jgi:methanogenic corrinoid protein MtbC1